MKRLFNTLALATLVVLAGCDANGPVDVDTPESSTKTVSIVDGAGNLRAEIMLPDGVNLPEGTLNKDGHQSLVITDASLEKTHQALANVTASKHPSSIVGDYCIPVIAGILDFCDDITAVETSSGGVEGHWKAARVFFDIPDVEHDGPVGCLTTFPGDFVFVSAPIDGSDRIPMRFHYPSSNVGGITFIGLNGGCEANYPLLLEIGRALKDIPGFTLPIKDGGQLTVVR